MLGHTLYGRGLLTAERALELGMPCFASLHTDRSASVARHLMGAVYGLGASLADCRCAKLSCHRPWAPQAATWPCSKFDVGEVTVLPVAIQWDDACHHARIEANVHAAPVGLPQTGALAVAAIGPFKLARSHAGGSQT